MKKALRFSSLHKLSSEHRKRYATTTKRFLFYSKAQHLVVSAMQSMKFGMMLLVLVLVCSIVGSLIQQGNEAAFYEQVYPSWGKLLLTLQLNNIFSSWYFLTLLALLCLNLIFCSLLRFKNPVNMPHASLLAAQKAKVNPISHEGREKLTKFLKSHRYRETEGQDCKVYRKNASGFYGSFLVHLSLLLILAFGAGSMYFAKYEDVTVFPGEETALRDGTRLHVSAFRTTDESGSTDYVSEIIVTDKNGNESDMREISVNYPLTFGGHVFYQQSYAVAGYLTVGYQGVDTPVHMTEDGFLTLDGNYGLVYYGVYPDYIVDENGQVALNPRATDYVNPIYLISKIEESGVEEGVVIPGETLVVGEVRYTFHPPVWVPGIRVKTNPPAILGLLYASFGVMILGLWLCFFHVPAYVKLDNTGYAVYSPKAQEELAYQLELLLKEADKC